MAIEAPKVLKPSGGPGDDVPSGQAGGTGVGAWSRRYTCGPRVEVGTRRPRLGDGSRRQADVQVTDELTTQRHTQARRRRRHRSSETLRLMLINRTEALVDVLMTWRLQEMETRSRLIYLWTDHVVLVRLPVHFKDFTL